MRISKCFAVAAAVAVGGATTHAQHGPVVPIDSIQYVLPQDLAAGNDAPSYFSYGDTVTVEGIVTFAPRLYGLSTNRKGTWIQDPAGGPWTGIHVLIDPGAIGYPGNVPDLNAVTKFYQNFIPGFRVKFTAVVGNYSGNTQLLVLPIESELQSITPQPVSPVVLPISTFQQNDGAGGQIQQKVTGEPYEGMLVEFQNVSVVNRYTTSNGTRWYWSVQDAQGNQIRIRDVSRFFRNDDRADTTLPNYTFTPPAEGAFLSYIRGIILEYNGYYYLAPRDTTDIGPIVFAPPAVQAVERTPVVPDDNDNVIIRATVTDDKDSVQTVRLYYRVGNGTIQMVPMTPSGTPDRYEGVIPPQADGSLVSYWIYADDNIGKYTYYPDSLTGGLKYVVKANGIRTLRDIQESPFPGGGSLWNRDTLDVNLHVKVMSTLDPLDLGIVTVQDGTGPYSGIFIRARTGDGVSAWKRGDSIHITRAYVYERFGVTYLSDIVYQKVDSGRALYPPVTTAHIDSLAANAMPYSEQFEGMLLEFAPAYVIDTNADAAISRNYGEWTIHTDSTATAGLRVDDFSGAIPPNFNVDSLAPGQRLDWIRGILFYSFGNFKLIPRNLNDIAGFARIDTTADTTTGRAALPVVGSVYATPNPASEAFVLHGDLPAGGVVVLYYPNGQAALRYSLHNGRRIALRGLAEGTYVGAVYDTKGRLTGVFRVVKRRGVDRRTF